MIHMIYLPGLHGSSSPHEQICTVSFHSCRKAVVLASLHVVALFLDYSRRPVVSCSVQGQLRLLLWSVQSFFIISL